MKQGSENICITVHSVIQRRIQCFRSESRSYQQCETACFKEKKTYLL